MQLFNGNVVAVLFVTNVLLIGKLWRTLGGWVFLRKADCIVLVFEFESSEMRVPYGIHVIALTLFTF